MHFTWFSKNVEGNKHLTYLLNECNLEHLTLTDGVSNSNNDANNQNDDNANEIWVL